MKQAVDALLAKMRSDDAKPSTIKTAEYRLGHFFGLPQNAQRPLRWISRRGSELYAAAQVGRSADTHQAELALAKQVGALAVKSRWLRLNPFGDIEPVGKKAHGADKARLRVDESRRLYGYCLEDCADQHRVITLGYLLMGTRASELVKRNVRDLDDGGLILWIEKTKTKAGTRQLLVPKDLRDPLLELAHGKSPDAPLFTREDGSRATRYWAYHHVKRICREAGVPELSPQGLRRTQTDMATDAGVSAIAVARHLGHTSTRVTDRSYRDRSVAANARTERAVKLLAGGNDSGNTSDMATEDDR